MGTRKRRCRLVTFVLAAGLGLGASLARATSLTFTASGSGAGGVALSASATFTISGDTLTILLVNTAPPHDGQDVPGNVLTGIFFSLSGSPTLTPVSALLPDGAIIVQADQCNAASCVGVTDVGGEFRYDTGSFPGGATYGIASAGYIGGAANFGGSNLDDPLAVDGINFGLIAADPTFNPNGGLAHEPLIRSSVLFTLTGVQGLTLADILHVSFQYGTDLSEANLPAQPIPEPGTWLLMATGLGLLVYGGQLSRRGRLS